jgi:predicted nucleotidyltransferase
MLAVTWWRRGESCEPISPAITPRYAGFVDIRVERRAAGLSQSQLARAAGVPQPNLSAYENGRRAPSPEVLDRIKRALAVRPSARVKQHREAIRALVEEHHAVSPRLFGSVGRGDDGPGSDVDLLVEFTDEASLLDEIGLRLALTDLLRVDVDVVGADTLQGRIRERVLREAVEV